MKTKSKTGRTVVTIVISLMVIVGIALMLYPTAADYINALESHREIADYQRQVTALGTDRYAQMLESARAYNERLAAGDLHISALNDEQRAEYEEMLNVTGTEIMGYIEISKINIYLPIYHGTEDTTLSAGVGHVEGSSLPVGGTTVHAVLSGHSGLPSAKLFSDIDQLVEGDTFALHVLNETLTYEVEQVVTVLPEELEGMRIERGRDLCSLITCTPYGVNTHRLVVQGHRIETPEPDAPDDPTQTEQSGQPGVPIPWQLIVVPLAVVIVAVTILLVNRRRRRHQ